MSEWEKGRDDVVNTEETAGEGAGEERTAMAEKEKKRQKRQKEKKPYRLSGSAAVKVLSFMLLAVFGFGVIGSAFICVYLAQEGYYTREVEDILARKLYPEAQEAARSIQDFLETDQLDSARKVCQDNQVGAELIWIHWDEQESVIWREEKSGGWNNQFEVNYKIERDDTVFIDSLPMVSGRNYALRFYVDTNTSFQGAGAKIVWGYDIRYLIIGAIGCFGLLLFVCIMIILCGAGHRRGRKEIVPGILTRLHLETLTFLFAGGICALGYGMLMLCRCLNDYWIIAETLSAAGVVGLIWAVVYIKDLAVRVKMGRLWRHSLIYTGLGMLCRGMALGFRRLGRLFRMLPSVIHIMLGFVAICLLELWGVMIFVRDEEGVIIWAIEKLILFFLVLYVAGSCKKLLVASRELARGQESYRVDTSRMLGAFKEHGENLNSMGQGISRAVEERMKSEHLKTELISNVSHDLKTPLTSIINYADIICEEASEKENEKIHEYAEVLLRQSRRLKKLLEDLMEASKATTGNLEVNLVPCEVGVLLSQAAGEYQQKMEERELELIVRQPEQPVTIIADGRHLWRVFDNLLNNICKYAQEKSRVYLNVETRGEQVLIVFRNMSKYALDISAEELEERFVRGDKSRHMEGNGLGLSIAKSLMELQNGKMEIVIDGDLFKVILHFGLEDEQDSGRPEENKPEQPKAQLWKPGILEVWNSRRRQPLRPGIPEAQSGRGQQPPRPGIPEVWNSRRQQPPRPGIWEAWNSRRQQPRKPGIWEAWNNRRLERYRRILEAQGYNHQEPADSGINEQAEG